MIPRPLEWMWLDASESIGEAELCRACRLETEDLRELVAYGALEPRVDEGAEWRFGADCLVPLRDAARLRAQFDLDLFSTALALGYLRRIDALEREVRSLRARLPRTQAPHEGPSPWREPHG